MRRKENTCGLLVGMYIGSATIENNMGIPQKILKIELPYDPAIPLFSAYPKEMETGPQRDIFLPMFIATLFITVKLWKCLSMVEWIKKI